MKKYRLLSGFTLVELMITVAIAAILITVAAPSFTGLLSSNSAKSAAERFANTSAYARSEAVTRSAKVTICSRLTDSTCGGLDWSAGWIVFLDTNNDNNLIAADVDANGDNDVLDPGDTDWNNDGLYTLGEIVLKVVDISSLSVAITATAANLCFNAVGSNSCALINFDILGGDNVDANGMEVNVAVTGALSVSHGITSP
jgi:prepilin-type N-terminal cleavage/methylation domain-containing protein